MSTAPGPMGGWAITDLCPCRCHRVVNPEDMFCLCRECNDLLDEE